MKCPKCQFADPEDSRFCRKCGSPTQMDITCPKCGSTHSADSNFCNKCGHALVKVKEASSTDSIAPQSYGPKFSPDKFLGLRGDLAGKLMSLYGDEGVITLVIALLQREGRVSYWALKKEFGFDDAFLEGLREELIFAKRVARDEGGKILIWTGGASPVVRAAPVATGQHATGERPLSTSPAASDLPPLSLEAERRQLSVMFCDLVDSTKLSGQLDPEDLREVIGAYQSTSAKVIRYYDGHIAQHLGDGLLIYFGWPRAHEDDAKRAVHTALGIIEALGPLNNRLEQQKRVRLAVRIAIHTGPVVVGEMGDVGRCEQLALGKTPNIAARLEELAKPDTVVISSMTKRLVQGAFALEDLGTHRLKGMSEPIVVARVLNPIVTQSGEEKVGPDALRALVGRDEEIGLLLRLWERSKQGLGQVVLISGEPGIGKSALADVLREHVASEGHTHATYRCSPYHTNTALYPVITHLQWQWRWEHDDTLGEKLGKMEETLQTTSLPLEEVVPLFAALYSLPLPEGCYRPLAMTPQRQRKQTQDALVAWLLEEAERQPVLRVWEDLHWTDPSTLELLSLLIDQVPTTRMLSVLTFRPDFVPPWPTRLHMTPLTLNRLERPQVEAMITQLVGGKALPAEVIQHIVAKTDGIPLFVEELTKMLLESDLLRQEADGYALTGRLSAVAIPATLHDSLMARLDRTPSGREVAQLCAVLGRQFTYEVLRAVAGIEEPKLQDGLAQLVGSELLYQRGRPPSAKYIFRHALIQEAAFASLLKRTRKKYHQQIAQTLKAEFPEMVEAEPEVLAHHYTEGGCIEHAITYWERAAQSALRRSANVEAIAHLKKGLELVATLPVTPECTQKELTLQTTLGPALMSTMGYAAPEVGAVYTRARELCLQARESRQLFPVLWGLTIFYIVRGEFETALDLGEQFLSRARRQNESALVLVAHVLFALPLFYLGEFAACCEHSEQGLTLYNAQSHSDLAVLYGQDPGVISTLYVAWAQQYLGFSDEALRERDTALTLARRLSHPYSLAWAFHWSTRLHQWRREASVVQDFAEQALAICRQQGFGMYAAASNVLKGWAFAAQGEIEDGIALLRQGLEIWRGTGAVLNQPYFLALLAEAHGKGGQIEEGLYALAEALAIVDKTGERFYEAELHRLKGALLLQRGATDTSQAESCFRKALEVARHQRAKWLELRAATCLSRLWRQQDKQEEARHMLGEVYNWFTEGFDMEDLREAKELLEELG